MSKMRKVVRSNNWYYLLKLNIYLLDGPAIPLPIEMLVNRHQETCTPIFTVVSFISLKLVRIQLSIKSRRIMGHLDGSAS